MKEQIIAVLRKWKDKGYYDFLKIADEIIRIAEFEELCKPDYAEMHMNDSVMQQNIDAALAEIKAELAEEKKSNKLLHEAMITAEKRGYDKALAESRAKMPSEDIDVAEMHMNDSVFKQNVNDAIAEKMPSEEEWIDIKDRMPESGQCVLIYSHSGGVAEGAWLSSKNHFEQWRWSAVLNDVTHWFIDVFLNNSEKYHNKIDKK